MHTVTCQDCGKVFQVTDREIELFRVWGYDDGEGLCLECCQRDQADPYLD